MQLSLKILALVVVGAFHAAADWVALDTTSYCQGTVTASGRHVFLGEAANNTLPLGTRVRVRPRVFGRSRFIILDRIGWGSQMDFYNPSCSAAVSYGRRVEEVRVTGR
jgi:hypothetical protein